MSRRTPSRSPASPEAFRLQVYAIVREIPGGRVMTYGGIAALIPPPAGVDWDAYDHIKARWVGYALADCPESLPWQRVVNAQGRVSIRPGHGPHLQRNLLEAEGVIFDERGRLDLKRYAWEPTPAWLKQHGLLIRPEDGSAR